LALVIALPFACDGCDEDAAGHERVSRDPNVQLRFDVARRLVRDIERRKLLGKETYGDCKMARALFARELRRLDAPAARRLDRRLVKLCAGAVHTVQDHLSR
jgi:hypothetical protein